MCRIVVAIVFCLVGALPFYGQSLGPDNIVLRPVVVPMPDDDDDDDTNTGARMPLQSITCTIDYSQKSITTSPERLVTSYELWDVNCNMCLGVYITSEDLIDALLQYKSGSIILKSKGNSYIGFFNN